MFLRDLYPSWWSWLHRICRFHVLEPDPALSLKIFTLFEKILINQLDFCENTLELK